MKEPKLGLWSGVGLNMGTMIGTGVFLSAGFMAASMTPGQILFSWLVGGVLAMAGARAYAEVAAILPRSGGEYRYLSDLVHPYLGYVAGWTSLLAGFSAPVAANASAAGPFAATIVPGLNPTVFGVALIVLVTLMHALDLTLSKWSQDLLAAAKAVLVVGFVVVGLAVGSHSVGAWQPPSPSPRPLGNFMAQLVFVMYAYSGWNTAIYAAEEFKEPRKTVPRAMVIGAALVMVLYLLVNFVLVANLHPDMLNGYGARQEVTLGHLVTQRLLGDVGGDIMSALVVVSLFTAMSSMTLVGPRVYDAMARDGFLPRIFIGHAGKPPLFSVLLQAAAALALLLVHSLGELITNIGILLTITSVLTVMILFIPTSRYRASPIALASAILYTGVCGWMLYSAISQNPRTLIWSGVIAVLSTVGYVGTRLLRPQPR
jgi:basic amino acid/polyamine antiporter, APA family